MVELLRGPLYRQAREAIIRYETTEQERATTAILELRDALDHLMVAAQSDEVAEVQRRADAAEEHLRRAAVEPAQDMVESRLHKLTSSVRLYWCKRLFFVGLPELS